MSSMWESYSHPMIFYIFVNENQLRLLGYIFGPIPQSAYPPTGRFSKKKFLILRISDLQVAGPKNRYTVSNTCFLHKQKIWQSVSFQTLSFFVQFFWDFVKKGIFREWGIPREWVIFPGNITGMGMRPHGNGNSRTSHISDCVEKAKKNKKNLDIYVSHVNSFYV